MNTLKVHVKKILKNFYKLDQFGIIDIVKSFALDNEIKDPNKNICAGIRWLFRKREITKSRLKREPTWEEVLMEYKGRLKSNSKKTQEIKEKIRNYLKQLE